MGIKYCGACEVGFSAILVATLLTLWKKKTDKDKAG